MPLTYDPVLASAPFTVSLIWHDGHARPSAGTDIRKSEPVIFQARKSVPRLRRAGQLWRKRLVHRTARRLARDQVLLLVDEYADTFIEPFDALAPRQHPLDMGYTACPFCSEPGSPCYCGWAPYVVGAPLTCGHADEQDRHDWCANGPVQQGWEHFLHAPELERVPVRLNAYSGASFWSNADSR